MRVLINVNLLTESIVHKTVSVFWKGANANRRHAKLFWFGYPVLPNFIFVLALTNYVIYIQLVIHVK
jgi:hypothetical protein